MVRFLLAAPLLLATLPAAAQDSTIRMLEGGWKCTQPKVAPFTGEFGLVFHPGGYAAIVPVINKDGTMSSLNPSGPIAVSDDGVLLKGTLTNSHAGMDNQPWQVLFNVYDKYDLRAQDEKTGAVSAHCVRQ